jgi:hypothetical protein
VVSDEPYQGQMQTNECGGGALTTNSTPLNALNLVNIAVKDISGFLVVFCASN